MTSVEGNPPTDLDRNPLLTAVLQSSMAAMIVTDTAGRIVQVNPAAEKLLGRSQAELAQVHHTALDWNLTDLSGNAVSETQLPIHQALQSGQAIREIGLSFQESDGIRHEVVVNTVPLTNPAGEVIGAICTLQGVSHWQPMAMEARLVNRLTEWIRQNLDLKTILQSTLNDVQRSLQADRVMIYQFSPEQPNGCVIAEVCDPAYPAMEGWRIQASPHPSEPLSHLYQICQPQAIADLAQSPLAPAYVELLQIFGVRAQLTIPLMQSKTLWGVLVAHQCSQSRPWQDREISLLQRLANLLLVAIQQSDLHQQLQQRNADLEALIQERTQEIQQFLEFEALLKRITDKVRDSLDEDQILLTVVEEVGLGLTVDCCRSRVISNDRQRTEHTHCYAPLLSNGHHLLKELAQLDRELPATFPSQFCTLMTVESPRSLTILHCPIQDKTEVLGDLWLCRSYTQGFSDLEVKLVQQVATQCAIALHQSRLYQTAQTQVTELAKLNRLKDDFLNTISHELRTPLSSIKMSIQLLELLWSQLGTFVATEVNKDSIPNKINQCLGILRYECDREIKLVSDLLALQQLEAGTHPLMPSQIQMKNWLPQVVETFADTATQNQQHLGIELETDLPLVTSDLFLLSHILQELLTNACKFTPAGGSITVTAKQIPEISSLTPAQIQISVSNTGVDIPTSELPLIFNQFYRVPSNDPWKYSGVGLGLALVEKMAHYLGGTVRAESERGLTRILVHLPITPARQLLDSLSFQ